MCWPKSWEVCGYAPRHGAVYEEEIVKIHALVAELTTPTATSAEQSRPAAPTLVANRPKPRKVTEAEWVSYLKSYGLWLKEG
jgi:hypothetical protein